MSSNIPFFQEPVASPIPDETVAEDKTDNPSTDIVLSPQWQAKFRSASPVAQQSHVSPPTLNPPNVIDESVSTDVLTSIEIRIIKQRNPAEALRKLQQLCHLSTDMPSLFSIVALSSELNVEVKGEE